MPAARQVATASATSGRGGSIMPKRPTKVRSCFEGLVGRGPARRRSRRKATPRTRMPRRARRSSAAAMRLPPGVVDGLGGAVHPDPGRQGEQPVGAALGEGDALVAARVEAGEEGGVVAGPGGGRWSCACGRSRRAPRPGGAGTASRRPSSSPWRRPPPPGRPRWGRRRCGRRRRRLPPGGRRCRGRRPRRPARGRREPGSRGCGRARTDPSPSTVLRSGPVRGRPRRARRPSCGSR